VPIALPACPKQIAFDFTARQSSDTGTMHFRFGNQAGSGDLDDIA